MFMPIESVFTRRLPDLQDYLFRLVFDPRQDYINHVENLLVRTLYPAG